MRSAKWKSISQVALAAFILPLCACVTSLRPDFPADWPRLVKQPADGGISGTYSNSCEDYTFDRTASKEYRPTIEHLFNLSEVYAESVRVDVRTSGELILSFCDVRGRELKRLTFTDKEGLRHSNGVATIHSVFVGGGGDSPRGRLESEVVLTRAEDGSLVIKTRERFIGLLYYIPLKDDVVQWVRFRRLSPENEPNQPPQRNAGSRPSSDASAASETPSSLGPRG